MIARIVCREVLYHWAGFLLGIVWVAFAVAAYLLTTTLLEAAYKETKRVQRDIGFNLRIVPAEADIDRVLRYGYTEATMPEEIAKRLSERKTVAYNHLVATLYGSVELEGREVLLTGLSDTMFPPGSKKPPMSAPIKPGTAHLGNTVAKRLGLKRDDTFELNGKELTVARVSPLALGTTDDLMIWVSLPFAQQILNAEGRIHEIQAIDCLCLDPEEDPLEKLQAEIRSVEPEVQVVMLTKPATARARQRNMAKALASYAIPIIVFAGAGGIALLSWLNVRSRLGEIALLRVLGHSSVTLAALVFSKACAITVVGTLIGVALAYYLANSYVEQLFPVTGAKFAFDWDVAWRAFVVAPLLACVASAAAATVAVTQDPAITLRGQ